MAEQTAVEWLIYRIKNQHLYDFKSLNELEEQAKAMEKEQIVNAWRNGDNDSMYEPKQLEKQAEQYYNETYNK